MKRMQSLYQGTLVSGELSVDAGELTVPDVLARLQQQEDER